MFLDNVVAMNHFEWKEATRETHEHISLGHNLHKKLA